MTWGTSAPSVILDVWYNNNIADENRRVMLTSVGVPVANMMGVVSSNIFLNQDAPKYIPALATTVAFGECGFVLTLVLGAWILMDNHKQGSELRTMSARTSATDRAFVWSKSSSKRHVRLQTVRWPSRKGDLS